MQMAEIYRTVPIEIRAVESEGEIARSIFIASTSDEDLAGDTIDPKGWVIPKDRKLPFLWGHQSRDPPIGRIERSWVEGKRLLSEVTWALKNARANELYELMKDGFISTCSVGFWPLEYKERHDEKRRFLGFEFTKQKLLELSLVNIPANPAAVVVQRSEEQAQLTRERLKVQSIERACATIVPNVVAARIRVQQQKARAFNFSGV